MALLMAFAGWLYQGSRNVSRVENAAEKSRTPSIAVPAETATYVGRTACVACHAEQDRLWQGSHHALAMQEANAATVLGNFNDTTFEYAGIESRFSTREGRFFVTTDGPDGQLHDYEVAYTFGVDPLQQYLIAFPNGRLQALSIAWDTRPKAAGGQRWFHLYPNERITHTDPLHWTGMYQNWNYMCAECHSTDLQRGYDAQLNRYQTRWSEMNVSCEACHGPGSQHLAWARDPRAVAGQGNNGLVVRFNERTTAAWTIGPHTGNAMRNPPRETDVELQACARCHSRRSFIWSEYRHDRPLLDSYLLQTLSEGLYYPDGQILDEVYEYGSFLQSKMYRAGVTCGDCHNPHSGKLRAEGNALCAACHLPSKYDTAAHHHHQPDSAGAACVACHMPISTYMVVDPRHDHSFRPPRPDLSKKPDKLPDAVTKLEHAPP